MKLRWIICIVISLAIHIVWLNQSNFTKQIKPKATVTSVTVAEVEPVHPPPARPTPKPEKKQPEKIAKKEPKKFRPNIEKQKPGKKPTQQEVQQPSEPEKVKPDKATAQRERIEKKAPPEKPDFKEEIADYRQQLLADFQDEWQKVPELKTVIEDLSLLPEIDKHFGIKILAYSFVEHKPGPPFIFFNMENNSAEKIDRFDFSNFSNRIKDRMIYPQYREKLEKARRQYNINSLMKVIGLVPLETDHYFSAKQLRAAELAGVNLNEVRATNAHYESNGTGGFNLIIDNVVINSGREIAVKDEELEYSVVAKN